jgi:hypothetical protein
VADYQSVANLQKSNVLSSTLDVTKKWYLTEQRKMVVIFIYVEKGYGCQKLGWELSS